VDGLNELSLVDRRVNTLFGYYVNLTMFEYRVTKYDPSNRDTEGRYLAEEWTIYARVGHEIGGAR
jgi:hypothetical protein